jgi:hypothetical protein
MKNLEYWSDEPEWQPIETAPKDGTVVLLSDGKIVKEGHYLGYWSWLDLAGDRVPTHWMPMPDPPRSIR